MRALASFSGVGVRTGLLGGALTAAGLALGVYFAPGSSFDAASAQEVIYFRIGAGTPGSTYYGVAGRIAATVSNPAGSRDCDAEGACGVAGLIGLAQTTPNPIEGLESLRSGSLEAALVSADIADAAQNGFGAFKKAGAIADLRAIANVGNLVLQIVVPVDSEVTEVKDLIGKKVAIGVADSDGAITAGFLLRAAGFKEKKTKLLTGDLDAASRDLAAGKIDALAVAEQLPSPEVAALLATNAYRLLPAETAADSAPDYILATRIANDTYPGASVTRAIGVPLVLVSRAGLPPHIAGGLVRALWHSAVSADEPENKLPLDMMSRASVPWHPGAAEAFRELSKSEPAAPPTPAPTN